jgi:DnaJ-class molecular chaperone
VDALCGTTLKIQTLDRRVLAIPVVECVDANSQKIVGGEGMPRASGEGRGDLIIIFEVIMPSKLTPAQKSLVRAGFFYPGKQPSPEQHAASAAFLNAANHGSKGWTIGFAGK